MSASTFLNIAGIVLVAAIFVALINHKEEVQCKNFQTQMNIETKLINHECFTKVNDRWVTMDAYTNPFQTTGQ